MDENFKINEDFVEFYEMAAANVETLSVMICDVLLRFGLNTANVRGQCYDGAAVMSGQYNGVAKRIMDAEKRAVVCTLHSSFP